MSSNDKLFELTGHEEQPQWSDCVLETDEIRSVRRSIDESVDELELSNLAVVNFKGGNDDYWVLDVKYEEFVTYYFSLQV